LGNAANNATWRRIRFNNNANFSMVGDSTINHVGETAIRAWQSVDPAVIIQEAKVLNEGGPGIHGYMQVASRVWDNGDGTWEYSYMVYNQNSTQGIYSFGIPSGGGGNLTNVWFNDVDYHSGEPQAGGDWVMTQGANDITFTCPQTFAQNIDANAINWGTGYSFGFTVNAGPAPGTGTLDLFEPGLTTVVTVPLTGPGNAGPPPTGTPYCFGDATGALCPCFNFGDPGAGCQSSSTNGATLRANGTASFSADTVMLTIVGVPGNKPGLLLRGDNQVAIPVGDGILCTTGASMRSQVQMTSNGSTVFTDFNGAGFGSVANAGSATNFQFWYRDPANTCTGAGFNFSNGVSLDYMP